MAAVTEPRCSSDFWQPPCVTDLLTSFTSHDTWKCRQATSPIYMGQEASMVWCHHLCVLTPKTTKTTCTATSYLSSALTSWPCRDTIPIPAARQKSQHRARDREGEINRMSSPLKWEISFLLQWNWIGLNPSGYSSLTNLWIKFGFL